jgi:hypothetical protein
MKLRTVAAVLNKIYAQKQMPSGSQTSICCHPDTRLTLDQLGTVYPEYAPTFANRDHFISAHHRFLSAAINPSTGGLFLTAPGLLDNSNGQEIHGWLRIPDALKLYEMAYYSPGDILELGTYEALSTCIMAEAIRDAGGSRSLITVDIEKRSQALTNARLCGLDKLIDFQIDDAIRAIGKLGSRSFGFVFVDHSHTYYHVKMVCDLLPVILAPSGFVLFHDYNDPRNGRDPDYGVYQAVADGLPSNAFRSCGTYGCTALYQRHP